MEKQANTGRFPERLQLPVNNLHAVPPVVFPSDAETVIFDTIADRESLGKSVYDGSLFDAVNPVPRQEEIHATAKAQSDQLLRAIYADVRKKIHAGVSDLFEQFKGVEQEENGIKLSSSARLSLSDADIDELTHALLTETIEEEHG